MKVISMKNKMDDQEDVFNKFDDPREAWNSRAIRKVVADATYDWLVSARNWKSFITLTFQDETPNDVALKRLHRLIKELNKDLLGRSYTKIVGHSYFSYAFGIEYQIRGVIHFHVLVDQPVNFSLLHAYWNDISGFAYISKIENIEHTVFYVTKYVIKGGQVETFLSKKDFYLKDKPLWWKD
jgi:hypothetical protein